MTHMIDAGKSTGDAATRDARARKAVAVFRSMQPVLTGYARAVTKRSDVRVILSATSNGETDGKNIMMRPPIALGDSSPHEHSLCGRRDLNRQQLCDACAKRDRVLVTIFHEISHIGEDSFIKPTDEDIAQILSDAVRASGSHFGKTIASRIKGMKFDSYLAMANAISEYMHPLLNSLEDARIDSNMVKTRPGMRPMYDALLNEVRDEGIEFQNPDTGEIEYEMWSGRPLNHQIIFGLYCIGTRYNYEGWFDPKVAEDLQDERLVELVTRAATSPGIREVYYECFPILERLRELGYCRLPDDPEPEPESDKDEDDKDEDKSEPESSIPSDCDDDSPGDDSDSEPKPDESDKDENNSSEDDDNEDEDEDEGDSHDSEDSERDPGSEDSESGNSGSGGSGSGTDSDQESPDDSGSEPEDEDSIPPEDENDGEEEDSRDWEGDERVSTSDTDESDESSDPGDDGTDSVDADDSDPGDEDGLVDDDFPATEDMSVDPKEMGTPEDASEFLNHAHDGSMEKVRGPAEVADTSTASVMDLSKFSREELEEAQEDLRAIIVAVIQGVFFDTPSRNITSVREHRKGQPLIERGMSVSPGWGNRRNMSEVKLPESIMGRALMRMRVAFSDNQRGAKRENLKSGHVNSRVLGRRAPVEDERLFLKKDRPKRKKYAVVLGIDISGSTSSGRLEVMKRAVYAQAELCARMGLPFEIYAHTGSPVDYKGYSWGGDLALDIYVVKDIHEPWNQETQNRLKSMQSTMCNLDGHTLEYYRKALDRAVGNTKVLVYYTDGAMPAENREEELEILHREIRICKRNGYVMLFVGVQNDEPKEKYGLDMVRLDDDSDIQRVVAALGDRIDRA
jgi:hypothetical protein